MCYRGVPEVIITDRESYVFFFSLCGVGRRTHFFVFTFTRTKKNARAFWNQNDHRMKNQFFFFFDVIYQSFSSQQWNGLFSLHISMPVSNGHEKKYAMN